MNISIPYGSIKSTTCSYSSHVHFSAFQFLMVRLKGWSWIYLRCPYWISIPYGSIKSLVTNLAYLKTPLFQFLMVRLKGKDSWFSNLKQIFQFLMVRLKVVGDCQRSNSFVFQFLMVRLKVFRLLSRNGVLEISIPYGSIKSRTSGWECCLADISIPYGSIKRDVQD